MRLALLFVACAVAAVGYGTSSRAAPPPDPVPRALQSGFENALGSLDMMKVQEAGDAERLNARKESDKLISAIKLSCDRVDAALVGRGHEAIDGKTVPVSAYEVSCTQGVGYVIVSHVPQPPIVMSCFAAAASPDAPLHCRLEANKDLKLTAATLMASAGSSCTVNDVRWFGYSASSRTDYSEVACDGGTGYLLEIPRTGAMTAVNCQEAARQGFKCRLTDGGPVSTPVTMQTFRDVLKQKDIHCEPAKMRLIGRESLSRRYVVEVQCAQQPLGLVAFIPLPDEPNRFETLDCAAAAERQIRCELSAKSE
jgi:hypothetical protein